MYYSFIPNFKGVVVQKIFLQPSYENKLNVIQWDSYVVWLKLIFPLPSQFTKYLELIFYRHFTANMFAIIDLFLVALSDSLET